MKHAHNFKDLTGKTIGYWVVHSCERFYSPKGHMFIKWLCTCQCGKTKYVHSTHLISGKSICCGCSRKLQFGEAAFNDLYLRYKHSARRRNHIFNLSKIEFKMITQQNCYYCNAIPSQISHKNYSKYCYGHYKYNGIDRLNPDLGYELNNCVACCGDCNYAKQGLTEQEFLLLIEKIYNHRILKNE